MNQRKHMLALVSNYAWIALCFIVIIETVGIVTYVINQKELMRNYEKRLEEFQVKVGILSELLLLLKTKKSDGRLRFLVERSLYTLDTIRHALGTTVFNSYESDLHKVLKITEANEIYSKIYSLADIAVDSNNHKDKLGRMASILRVHEGNVPSQVTVLVKHLRTALEGGGVSLLDIDRSENGLSDCLRKITAFLKDASDSRTSGFEGEIELLQESITSGEGTKAEPEPVQKA